MRVIIDECQYCLRLGQQKHISWKLIKRQNLAIVLMPYQLFKFLYFQLKQITLHSPALKSKSSLQRW
jgi:hypothetical protein